MGLFSSRKRRSDGRDALLKRVGLEDWQLQRIRGLDFTSDHLSNDVLDIHWWPGDFDDCPWAARAFCAAGLYAPTSPSALKFFSSEALGPVCNDWYRSNPPDAVDADELSAFYAASHAILDAAISATEAGDSRLRHLLATIAAQLEKGGHPCSQVSEDRIFSLFHGIDQIAETSGAGIEWLQRRNAK